MLGTVNFEIASEAALYEFVWGQGRSNDGAGAISSHYELAGAKRFMEILRRIADKELGAPIVSPGQLNYDALNPTRELKKEK